MMNRETPIMKLTPAPIQRKAKAGVAKLAESLSRLCVAVLIWAGGLLWAAPTSAATTSTPGSFAVGESGASSYAIPIEIPPGIAGMTPKLALQYNSQGGNGLAGMGWSLGGMSAITRCRQTVAQDGTVTSGAVTLGTTDRFCLDGQRLMAVNGNYELSGSEYRTERQDFSKIVSAGSAGGQIASFQVQTKSGLTMQYGYTANSQVRPQNQAVVATWLVNKVTDKLGNYYQIIYSVDAANGQNYPLRIEYTGTSSTAPNMSVQFQYEARALVDQTTAYHAGMAMTTIQRLQKIQTCFGTITQGTGATPCPGGKLVKEYRLDYDAAGSPSTQRTRLASIRECADSGASNCLPPTSVTWSGAPTTWNYSAISPFGTFAPNEGYTNSSEYPLLTGDWNGDGRTDVARVYMWGVKFYVATEGGGWTYIGDLYDFGVGQTYTNTGLYPIVTGDWNGDGLTDIGRVWEYGMTFYTSNGVGGWNTYADAGPLFGRAGAGATAAAGGVATVFTGDWNGDGRTDIARITDAGVLYYVSTGGGWSNLGTLNNFGIAAGYTDTEVFPLFVGDWNGDGKTDIGRVWSQGVVFYTSNGDGTWNTYFNFAGGALAPSSGYANATEYPILMGDWNGDGKTDIARAWCCGLSFYVSNGAGFTYLGDLADFSLQQGYNSTLTYPLFTGDWNGDGKTDIGRVWDGGVQFYLSNGRGGWNVFDSLGFYGPAAGYLNGDQYPLVIGDWDGDGRSDFARVWCCGIAFLARPGELPDVAKGFTTGLGASVSISYQPLTNSTVYTKSSGSVYPLLDIQAPLYVVSSMTASNGLGGTRQMSYGYSGARADLSGRGFLGFYLTTSLDVSTNTKTYNYFHQTFPKTGLSLASYRYIDGNATPLNYRASYYYELPSVYQGRTVYTVLPKSNADVSWEINSNFVSRVNTDYVYDSYGNPTQIVATNQDAAGNATGYSKTTTNTYATPDTANWILGRLIRSTVQSTCPGTDPVQCQ